MKTLKFDGKTIIDLLIVFYLICILILTYSSNYLISNITALILIVVLLGYAIMHHTFIVRPMVQVHLMFLFVCYLSILWSADKSMCLQKCVTLTELFVLFVLLYNYITEEHKVDFLIKALIFAGTFFAIYTITYYGLGNYFAGILGGSRMGSDFQNTNGISIAIGPMCILSFWYIYYRKAKLYWVPFVICAVAVFGTGSRTGIVATFLAILISVLFKGDSFKRIKSVLLVAAILIAVYFLLKLPMFSLINDRMELLFAALRGETSQSGGTAIRLRMMELGFQSFLKNPFTGVGIGCSSYITRELGLETYLHNNYVELLASIGIFGFVAYYLFYIVPSAKLFSWAKKQEPYSVLSISLIVFRLAAQMGTVEYSVKMTYIYFVLFFSICEYSDTLSYNENM